MNSNRFKGKYQLVPHVFLFFGNLLEIKTLFFFRSVSNLLLFTKSSQMFRDKREYQLDLE